MRDLAQRIRSVASGVVGYEFDENVGYVAIYRHWPHGETTCIGHVNLNGEEWSLADDRAEHAEAWDHARSLAAKRRAVPPEPSR